MLLVTIFGEETSNISSDIERKPSFIYRCPNDLCGLENKVKVTQFELGLRHALVLQCTKFGEDLSRLSILSGNHLSYAVFLKNKGNTLFKLGLCLSLVLLGTILGEDTSNITSDIE